jgi:glutathione S-transferase
MQLYHVAGSPRCRKVRAGVAPLDLFSSEYPHAVNPNGRAPALAEGGRMRWESKETVQ